MYRVAILIPLFSVCTYAVAVMPDSAAAVRHDAAPDSEKHDHKDDDKHEHKEGDDHKGAKHDLGQKAIGAFTVNVAQFGEIKAGEEAVFVVALVGSADKPKAVRGWVGVESGERSIKSKAEDEGKEYHLHHPVSKALPEKAKLWIELETSTGKAKAAFDLK